jgi:prepilin peptidase CpaA
VLHGLAIVSGAGAFHRLLQFAPVIALLTWAAVIDLRERRIPNWLTGLLMISGIGQSFFPAHTVPPGDAVMGFFAAAIVPFALFVLGAMGGGDVKLMAGLGTWMGPAPAMLVLIVEKVIGLLIVLTQAAMEGRLQALFRNSVVLTANVVHIKDIGVENVARNGRRFRSVSRPLPFAVPTLAAVIVVLCFLAGGR